MMDIHHSHLHKREQRSGHKGFQLKTIILISLNTQHQHQSQVALAARGCLDKITPLTWIKYTQHTLGIELIRTVRIHSMVLRIKTF